MAKKISKYITDPEVLELAKKEAQEFVESYKGKTVTQEDIDESRVRLNEKMDAYLEEHPYEKEARERKKRTKEHPKGNFMPTKKERPNARRKEKIERIIREANGEHILEEENNNVNGWISVETNENTIFKESKESENIENYGSEKTFDGIIEENNDALSCIKNEEPPKEIELENKTGIKDVEHEVIDTEYKLGKKEETEQELLVEKKEEKAKPIFKRPYYHMGMRIDY